MSRSKPNDTAPNPAVRWFEWNGEHGHVRYYDKDAKASRTVPLPFTFLLLDQLGSVRGWHDASESGIYSNEVKDTRQDALLVKAFKGGTLGEGLYKDIKDRVHTLGGRFVSNCYIAFKVEDDLAIASLRFKGAALNAWVEFSKAHRSDIWNKAVTIASATEGKKGRIVFYVPEFKLSEVSDETNAHAVALDKTLQAWLGDYLKRTTHERAEEPEEVGSEEEEFHTEPLTDDDIPF